MYIKRFISASLSALVLVPVLAGCGGDVKADTDTDVQSQAEEETAQSTDGEDTTAENPIEDGEAILKRLLKSEYIKNQSAKASDTVTRASFAYDVMFYAGFSAQQALYICENVYTDMEKYSADMRHAEIAVNQGLMLKPEGTEFKPSEPVTYEEVIRGLLYALGYREYAESYGVSKLAAETGLTKYVSSKAGDDTLTYKEYAQLVSNALEMTLVICVEKDGQLSVVQRGSEYNIETAYIKNKPDEADSLFRIANSGWDIFPGDGYRYGPSMIINDDGTIDCWLASNSGIQGEIDWGKYRRSYDNGFTWTTDTGAVRPTSSSEDWNWSCDPGVVKIGEYYYAAYTSILWHDGLDNNLFIARSKTPAGAFVEKWCGDGWEGDPKPVVTYDGIKKNWGCGEGSMVVVGDTLYLYVSWNDNTGDYTKVYTADAKSENWPATLKFRGTAYKHGSAEDSADIKYVDAYNCFISVATSSRFTEDCCIHVMTSYDGIFFRNEVSLKHKTKGSNIQTCIHNMGITGDASGHIDIFNTQQYVGYAYQPAGYNWGNWKTRLSPIVFLGSDNYDKPENVISRDSGDKKISDTKNTPAIAQIRIAAINGGRAVRAAEKGKAYGFIVSTMLKNGDSREATQKILSEIEYRYDKNKVSVDKTKCTVTLLCDEVVRVYASYNGLECEFSVVPDYLDTSAPVEFYPETETVTFYYRNEAKQPAFIAKSAKNDYLMLWRGISSYTSANAKDQTALSGWDQSCEYSGYDESIIKIDAEGKITPVKVGETTITAKYMGLEATMKVVVEKLK